MKDFVMNVENNGQVRVIQNILKDMDCGYTWNDDTSLEQDLYKDVAVKQIYLDDGIFSCWHTRDEVPNITYKQFLMDYYSQDAIAYHNDMKYVQDDTNDADFISSITDITKEEINYFEVNGKLVPKKAYEYTESLENELKQQLDVYKVLLTLNNPHAFIRSKVKQLENIIAIKEKGE